MTDTVLITFRDDGNGNARGTIMWKGQVPRVGDEVIVPRLGDPEYEDRQKVKRIVWRAPGVATFHVEYCGFRD